MAKTLSIFLRGLSLSDNEKVECKFLWLYLYITKGTKGHANRVWFDDVVVAKEYIGPLH